MPPTPAAPKPQPKQLAAFPEPKAPPKPAAPKALGNAKAPRTNGKPRKQPQFVPDNRPVIYPYVEIRIYADPPEGSYEHPILKPLVELMTGAGLQMPESIARQIAKLLSDQNMGYQGPMTCEKMKTLLFWETEAEYAKRMVAEAAARGEALDVESCRFEVPAGGVLPDGSKAAKVTRIVDYTLTDSNGEKVMCWNNLRNRPLDEATYSKYGQDMLNKEWEFNLENFIISTTSNVISGQHRGIGFVLACQMWARKDDKGKHWRTVWPQEPTIDMLVAFGFVESERTMRSIDNVRPRKLEDVFYTSGFFQGKTNAQRKELARMLDVATDFLWKRTRAGDDSFTHYQTHSISVDFVNRHKRLLECVNYLYEANSINGRAISAKGLSAGECSAMMYLMGSSGSDAEAYYKPNAATGRGEKKLNWDRWDRACEFFTLLAGNSWLMKPVVTALGQSDPVTKALGGIKDHLLGEGGTRTEQAAVLAKAWGQFLTDDGIQEIGFCHDPANHDPLRQLLYRKKDGTNELYDWPEFGGIDEGPPKKKEDKADEDAAKQPDVSPEEMRKQRAKDLADALVKRRAEAVSGKPSVVADPGSGTPGQPGKPAPPTFRPPTPAGPQKLDSFPGQPAEGTGDRQLRLFAEIETENPDKLLIWKGGDGYFAVGKHCTKFCELIGCDPLGTMPDGKPRVNIASTDWEEVVDTLCAKGQVVGLIEKSPEGNNPVLTQMFKLTEKPAAKAPPIPKPAQPNMKPVSK